MGLMSLKDKTIVMGVTGGIAAYKSADLIRLLVKAGATVHVVMTESAKQFITPLTLQTLSHHPVHTDLFNLTDEVEIGHISLADRADAIVIAPATANLIAKAAHGLCDDLLSTILVATQAPIIVAPAMNCHMWENPITQRNLSQLRKAGYHVVSPESGELACGYTGVGRMAEIDTIVECLNTIVK